MQNRHGIAYNDPSNSRQYLALEELRARVVIVDLTARVQLEQLWSNKNATGRATFYFPVPASASVCSFRLKTSDGRTVKAICKEKTRARAAYEQALADGQQTSLVEWVSDDIFTVSVGSIPASSTVSTTLVYTMALPNDENTDELRFQLPSCVGERYGPPLAALDGASAPSSSTRIRLSMDVQTSGSIHSIVSPSHPITETPYLTEFNRPSRRRRTVKYRSKTFLDRDFVVVVQADGLDEPRCFAELSSDPTGRHSDTVAMQLSLVPKFKLPPVLGQEYVFLVDRSGSMAGPRMETAKRTLNLLLRMLPAKGSKLNIFSFGYHHTSLWPSSRVYDEAALQEASSHVGTMDSNYGGTEIRSALESVFASRDTSGSTAVFVLTDGDVMDPDSVIQSVQHAVKQSKAASRRNRLRVFCLGIGDGISTALCEGIARAGNGVCLFAVHTESIVGKLAALFQAGKRSFVHNIAIDWGVNPDDANLSLRSTVNFSTPRSSPTKVHLRPAPTIQQSPAQVADLHAGTRLHVFAIITLRKKSAIPKEVVITGDLDGGGPFRLVVPVRGIQLESQLPVIHTMAAWRLIQDHQEGTQPLAVVVAPLEATDDAIREASIIRLGERYQVASRHTSFVVVVDDKARNRAAASSRSSRRSSVSLSASRQRRSSTARDAPATGLWGTIWNFFSPPDEDSSSEFDMHVPGGWRDSVRGDTTDGYESADSLSTLSSFEGGSDSWSDWTDEPRISDEDAQRMQVPSPKLEPVRLAPADTRVTFRQQLDLALPPPVAPPPPPAVDPKVVQLVELQSFDGSFTQSIQSVVGDHVLQLSQGIHHDTKLWTTVVAVAFLQKNLAHPGQKELLDDLVEKAYVYLYSNGWDERTVKRLVQTAKDVL
ncbi:hypothetical protein HMN09_00594900 [Mycena chlorophos]|uniref:Uncharacterized protein n=1 Tax=Mycena chlorophos TaxID=658473 RepID=A0A8H6T3V7_MYCCL|nr:hypothetical protein HMN09_00594900 [Mycena chlorophos]